MKNDLIATGQQISARTIEFLQRHPRHVTTAIAALLLGGAGATFAVATWAPQDADIPVHQLVESVQPQALAEQVDSLQSLSQRLYRSDATRSSDTADTLLRRLGVADPKAAAFLRSDALSQQAVLGRAGRNVRVETGADNSLLGLSARWTTDDSGSFKRLTVSRAANGSFQSRVETLPLTVSSVLSGGSIDSSLYAATDDAHIPDAIASQVAEIFSGDIDFRRALRKGDRFTVVYETLMGDGETLRTGRVLSAEFVNAGKTLQAMWFQEAGSTKGAYYSLDGQSLRRAYLSAPVAFSRVTSGFSMRFHPILKLWKNHLGTDFAASIGTPARSVGDGVVEFAGVQNGYGNVVFVRHNSRDVTVYAHLSKLLVKRGERVSQGQTIALTGATGWATGPHLHFEFRVNGVPRDPMSMARLSPSVPIAPSAKAAFAQAAGQVRAQLATASRFQGSSVQ